MDTPDFFKLTHLHEDKKFDRLDQLFPKFKDENWIERDNGESSEWPKGTSGSELPSDKDS